MRGCLPVADQQTSMSARLSPPKTFCRHLLSSKSLAMAPMAESTAHLYIVHPFKAGGMANLFSTHPPMEERVRRLRDMAYRPR